MFLAVLPLALRNVEKFSETVFIFLAVFPVLGVFLFIV